MRDTVTWKIGGEAGFGIMSAGNMVARTYSRLGYHIFVSNEYPSLIRGGHNIVTARISSKEFYGLNKDVHILVALNRQTVEIHKDEVSEGGLVVYDPKDSEWDQSAFSKKVHLLPVPLADMVKELSGDKIMRNTLALGATIALLGTPFETLQAMITDQFLKKGQDVVDSNVKVAKTGYDFIQKTYGTETSMVLSPGEKKEKSLVINGSEAFGVAAVRSGLKFAAIYPMTPINAVINFLADHAKSLNIVYKQPEDEIAGINMAIGASLAGVRSMVATSGGGFALMVEGLSLAGIMEVPLVIDLGMRAGPATGMPTWTEQAELQFAIHAGHGEFPRIVLAPGDAEECFTLTTQAFNLADRYQIPVLVLTDKYLNETQWCVRESHFRQPITIDRGKLVKDSDIAAETNFKRYSLTTDDGVSPRSVPGMKNGYFYSNSYEHDETGHMTENPIMRRDMAAKRLNKFLSMEKEIQKPTVYGPEDADMTLVGWGTTKGVIIDALASINYSLNGKSVNFLHFQWMFPFPSQDVLSRLSKSKVIVDVENNATAQLASLIREHTGINIEKKLLKNDGRPFYPEDIVSFLQTI
jgi:2-oxoglutarate ferredoxin oxidoreductase subunit alpha